MSCTVARDVKPVVCCDCRVRLTLEEKYNNHKRQNDNNLKTKRGRENRRMKKIIKKERKV